MVWPLLPTPPHAGLVKFLQPHSFRLSTLLPPHEVARYAAQQQRGQGAAAAADSKASSKAGSKAQAPPAAPERLPYVPEFYSFGSAVKQDPRLLLRHADLALTTAGASEAAGSGYGLAAGWEAVRGAALGSPSCLLRSLAFLFCGSTTLATSCWGSAAAAASLSAAEASAAAASAAAVYPAPPAPTFPASTGTPASSPTAGASTAAANPAVVAPARRQHSAEWSLAAGHFLASRRSSSEPASAGGSSPQQRAAAAGPALSHAESIVALLPLPASRSNSSSCGDEGHLWAAAAASPSGTAGQQAGDGGHLVGASAPHAGSSAPAAAGGAPNTAAAAAPSAAGPAGGNMASAAASVAALAAEIAAAIEHDFDSQSTGEGYWWMWNS